MKHFPLMLRLLALLALLLPGCGDDSAPAVLPQAETNAPTWRLAREDLPSDGTGLTLHARGPVRARLRLEGTHLIGRTGEWHDLAAGQTVTVYWTHAAEPGLARQEAPGPQEEAEGRTEVHCMSLAFQIGESIQAREILYAWTRPGLGRELARDLLPPGRTAALPPRAELELCTLAVTDLARARASLRSHEWHGVLRREGPESPGDRTEIVRLFLDVETTVGG